MSHISLPASEEVYAITTAPDDPFEKVLNVLTSEITQACAPVNPSTRDRDRENRWSDYFEQHNPQTPGDRFSRIAAIHQVVTTGPGFIDGWFDTDTPGDAPGSEVALFVSEIADLVFNDPAQTQEVLAVVEQVRLTQLGDFLTRCCWWAETNGFRAVRTRFVPGGVAVAVNTGKPSSPMRSGFALADAALSFSWVLEDFPMFAGTVALRDVISGESESWVRP